MDLGDHLPLIASLFQLIDDDWALCDDSDRDAHMVLVDEGRNTHSAVMPTKELVFELVRAGYLEYEDWSERPDHPRDPTSAPRVYSFRVTTKGRELA